jgi:hypothetical protein
MTEIEPGFWWAKWRHDGSFTVVQITGPTKLAVMFIGNLMWPSLAEALEDIEIVSKIEEPPHTDVVQTTSSTHD